MLASKLMNTDLCMEIPLFWSTLINEDQWLWTVEVELFVSGVQIETRIVIADSS